MQRLNPAHYRVIDNHDAVITRDNIETYLTHGIETVMNHGKWWRIRRNGKTQTWKRNRNRIRIPFKVGFKGYGAITETDFVEVPK